ncbi:MAG: site-specific integrase [Alphaproteobacteria bacterium]|nr:site-specific integrase [Alphaproteobacteria bacterium]
MVKSKKVTQKSYPEIPVSKIREMMGVIKNQRPDFYRVIYFLLRTGRRVEETTLIEKSDVILGDNFTPKTILVRAETTKTKTKSSLELFDEDLRLHIREAYASSASRKAPYLFINKDGRKCNQQRICAFLKLVSKAICGVTITPHYFRHRFLTECAKQKVPLKDSMSVSGLRDFKVLMTYYSHVSQDGMVQVYNATKI